MDAVSYSHADKQKQRIEKFIKDPDSSSGIVTVPKVIGAGENVTVPAGRVAVLPNVQVDGEIVVETGGEIFIPAGATLSGVVELDGDQTIDGIKTFVKSPIVPTPTAGTQVANKLYVDNQTVDNILELKTIDTTIHTNVNVLGYYTKGDGGGGTFYWDATSTEDDNGGTIIQATGITTGRWKRVNAEKADIRYFGAKANDEALTTVAFLRVLNYIKLSNGGTAYIPSGVWSVGNIGIFDMSCSNFSVEVTGHLIIGNILLAWHPSLEPGSERYSNINFYGFGTIEAKFNSEWHNDLVYVTDITVQNLTFIRPCRTGHFLDLMGCNNVLVNNVTVKGSSLTRRNDTNYRLYSEFVQVSGFTYIGLGWQNPKYPAGYVDEESLSNNIIMTNCLFEPYTDDIGTTFPPRPIGNHGQGGYKCGGKLKIENNIFNNIIAQTVGERGLIELPNCQEIIFVGNSIITDDAVNEAIGSIPTIHLSIINSVLTYVSSYIISNNTFKSSWNRYFIAARVYSSGNISIENNNIDSTEAFSDLLVFDAYLDTRRANITICGNNVLSGGRRFVHALSTIEDRDRDIVISSNNILHMDTPPDVARPAISISSAKGKNTIVGNNIKGWNGFINGSDTQTINTSTTTVTGNIFSGGSITSSAISIKEGIISGNVFKNCGPTPVVRINGANVASNGNNYVVLA